MAINLMNLPNIYGFNETSEAGSNIFAPSIFLGNCNFRCPYCMNSKLVKMARRLGPINISEVRDYVTKEKCEWVNISGGEPTVTAIELLANLMNEIRSWGCKIGLSTNGNMPYVIHILMPLINYISMDIKCVRAEDYRQLMLKNDNYLFNVIKTQAIMATYKLSRKDFDYEIRTTLYPKFIDSAVIKEIGSILRRDDKWVLQQFRHTENMLDESCRNVSPYTDAEVDELVEIAKKYCDNVQLKCV